MRSASSGLTPARSSSPTASSRRRFSSGTPRKRPPRALGQPVIGDSRPDRITRALSGRAGTNRCRSQGSSSRKSSYVSRTRMTRSPRLPIRAAASSAVARRPPVVPSSAARKPRSVGSIDRQSRWSTVVPRARASTANASTSVDLPMPAIPWTKTTRGPPSPSSWRRTAISSSRPTSPIACSSMSWRTVRVIARVCASCQHRCPSSAVAARRFAHPNRHVGSWLRTDTRPSDDRWPRQNSSCWWAGVQSPVAHSVSSVPR